MKWLVLAVALSGCATSNCDVINSRRRAHGAVATLAGALTGAGGVSTLAVTDERWRTGVAVSSVALGGIAAFASYLSSDYAQDYSDRRCGAQK